MGGKKQDQRPRKSAWGERSTVKTRRLKKPRTLSAGYNKRQRHDADGRTEVPQQKGTNMQPAGTNSQKKKDEGVGTPQKNRRELPG